MYNLWVELFVVLFVIIYFFLIKELRMKEIKFNVVNEIGLYFFVLECLIFDLCSSLC